MNINNPTILPEKLLKKAFKKYADSHWIPPENPKGTNLIEQLYSVRPMEHSFESFSNECNNNKLFYNKYK